jgi:hypothetical protein
MAESRAQLKERLIAEDLWQEAVQMREELKANGMTPKDAWAAVSEAFPPGGANGYPKPPTQVKPERAKRKKKDRWDVLVENAIGRTAPEAVNLRWVFDNAPVNPDKIDPEDVPSPGAVGLLREVQVNATMRAEFYRSMYVRLVPSKTQLEAETRFLDDGRTCIETIERVQRAAEDSVYTPSTEGVPSQPPLPQGDDPAGQQ